MMDNFTHILRWISAVTDAPATSSRFGDATPFKVQFNFDIPLFEGKINANALYNWLNFIEGYFSVHNFFDREKITFALLKTVPHVQNWWHTYCEQNNSDESGMFETNPTWASFIDVIKEQYYPVGNYDDQYTKWTILRQERDQTNFILCGQSWVSKTPSGTSSWNIAVVYIGTSELRWTSSTSLHLDPPIGMLSKSRRNFDKRTSETLDLWIHCRRKARETLARRTQ